jgi:fimbrial isopeptide formation D2 family protein
MKTKITLICLLIVMNFASKAQNYVTIPDANFVIWLTAHIPSAMNGNLMDTSSTAVTTLSSIDVGNNSIADLTGIQYFDSLKTLDCGNDNSGNPNSLTSLPPLPTSLETLVCNGNSLTSLPTLPNALKYLMCYFNQLTSLPTLPNLLQFLNCSNNLLTSIPILPSSLQILGCVYNQLTSLPILPDSLQNIQCYHNQLMNLPSLPNTLTTLVCSDNQLTSLPSLPNTMTELNCSNNQLTVLPTLQSSLLYLSCAFNQLTSLPPLPDSLQNLYCNNNNLTSFPFLPNSIFNLGCGNNNISCFPTFPNTFIDSVFFSITPNPFTCLPNYISAMNFATHAYPLCVIGDTINNVNNCTSSQGITGFTYKDNNINCIKDGYDLNLVNIPLKLYDSNNTLLCQTYSAINGIYEFRDTSGTYIVNIDTTGMPFTVQCTYPGIDSTVTLTNGNPLATDVNFAITCKPGFDVGVQSVFQSGWVFPGQQHELSINAGDMNQWYNLNCANGISGQVQVSVTGSVTYTSIAAGSLTPIITGNVFTYTIADFGTIYNAQDFGLLFTTDTTAQAGDQICVNVTVTPTNGDNNTSNNNYQFCYQVINSYDPNLKEVYPIDVLPGYQDWFTYTIHFQNTGTAPAFNIRLVDTLSNNLDLETFQVINYSHHNTISLKNKVLTVRFPNIMLTDSTSNLEGSKGFVQYRVKPKPNLPLGTQIKNTANIYFDYNAPIVTNTTINEYTQTASLKEIQMNSSISVYPNPGNGKYYVKLPDGMNFSELSLEVYNLLGELVISKKPQNSLTQIDLSQQPNGIYIVRVNGSKQSLNQRIIKQ